MRTAWLALAVLSAVACSPSTDTPNDGGTDAVESDAPASDGATDAPPDDAEVSDATSDALSSDASDAGVCVLEPGDAATCNTIAPTGNDITPTCPTGTAPTPTGGTIADGHYVLTATAYYGDDSGLCQTPVPKTDWLLCGTQWETAAGGNNGYNMNFTATVTSADVQLDRTCGGALSVKWQYDATPTTLTFYIPRGSGATQVDSFTKQ